MSRKGHGRRASCPLNRRRGGKKRNRKEQTGTGRNRKEILGTGRNRKEISGTGRNKKEQDRTTNFIMADFKVVVLVRAALSLTQNAITQAASEQASCTAGCAEVYAFLAKHGLEQYADKLVEEGYGKRECWCWGTHACADRLRTLRLLTDDEVDQLSTKPGHRKALKLALTEARNTLATTAEGAAEAVDPEAARYFDPKVDLVPLDPLKPQYDVFVSHAGEQKKGVVSFLVDYLEDWGLRVFVDYRMGAGDPATENMRHAASHAKVGLFVLSPDFFGAKKEWTYKELLIFQNRNQTDKGKAKILPFFYGLGPWDKNASHLSPFAQQLLNWVSEICGEKKSKDSYDADLFKIVAKKVAHLADSPLVTYLSKGSEPLPEGAPPSAFLNARYEVVPFMGRDDFVGEFMDWCKMANIIALRIVHGDGGTGKTRTMVELVKRLRHDGIRAGFLQKGTTTEKFEKILGDCVNRRTVIVIDYADGWPNLRDLLQAVAIHKEAMNSGSLRIILLSRNAGEWVDSLAKSFDTLISEQCVRPMPSLPIQDRETIFHQALESFSKHVAPATGSSLPAPSLDESVFGRVLYVQMAALATCLGLKFSAPSDLLEKILAHEERYWLLRMEEDLKRKPNVDEEKDVRLLVSAVALRDGASEDTVKAIHARLDLDVGLEAKRIYRILRQLYPGSAKYVASLQPDILSEGLIGRVLPSFEDADDLLAKIFEDNDERALEVGFALLGRMSAENSEAADWILSLLKRGVGERAMLAVNAALAMVSDKDSDTRERAVHSRLGDTIASILERADTTDMAKQISDVIPQNTVSLRKAALWAEAKLVKHYRSQVQAGAKDQLDNLATSLNNLDNKQSALGQREAALTSTQEAMGIYQRLAKDRPDAFLPDLAMSLNNLGGDQSALGQREAALQSAQEAVKQYKQLAKDRPDAFLPNLATSLNNLGIRYSDLGQREAALQSSLEAIDIRRQLAKDRPDAFLPNLATSLNNLGMMQSALGQRKAALQSKEEAVEIRRLAKDCPDAFLPDLAGSLNNLGSMQSGLGQRDAALQSIQEAVEIYEQLAKDRPDAFTSYLAASLGNLGNWQSALDQREAALKSTQEAVEIYEQLAKDRPDAFLPDLAGSLNNLGALQSELGQHEATLQSIQEAESIHGQFAKGDADPFLPNLALSLNNLGDRYNDLTQQNEAQQANQETIKVHTATNVPSKELILSLLQNSPLNLGNCDFQGNR